MTNLSIHESCQVDVTSNSVLFRSTVEGYHTTGYFRLNLLDANEEVGAFHRSSNRKHMYWVFCKIQQNYDTYTQLGIVD